MWKFSLLTAMQSVEKSMGFVLQRWVMFLGVAFGFLLATLAGAGTAIGIGSLSANPTLFGNFGAFAGFTVFAWVLYKSRQAIHRSIRFPHLLLLARLTRKGAVPEGRAQVDFARRLLAENYPDANRLWEIRTLCRSALAVLPRVADLPIIATSSKSWQVKILENSAAWLSSLNVDLIIASLVTEQSADAWASARSGILLQETNLSLLLKNRFYLVLFEALGWILSYALLLVAFNKIAGALPFDAGFWPHIFALIFGWNIKASFLEPIAQASMMQLELAQPDAAVAKRAAERLAADSEAFRTLQAQRAI